MRSPDFMFVAWATQNILIGYIPTGYIFFNSETWEIFEKYRNVRFNEKLAYAEEFKIKTENLAELIWNYG